jgi:hypothetical protein
MFLLNHNICIVSNLMLFYFCIVHLIMTQKIRYYFQLWLCDQALQDLKESNNNSPCFNPSTKDNDRISINKTNKPKGDIE